MSDLSEGTIYKVHQAVGLLVSLEGRTAAPYSASRFELYDCDIEPESDLRDLPDPTYHWMVWGDNISRQHFETQQGAEGYACGLAQRHPFCTILIGKITGKIVPLNQRPVDRPIIPMA